MCGPPGRLAARRSGFRPHSLGPLLLAVTVLAAAFWWRWYCAGPSAPESLVEGVYQIERIVDVDTLLLTNGAQVRLIGVKTPEPSPSDHSVDAWGPEARQFTETFLSGRLVRLQFDRQRLDRDRRLLAYVWVEDRMLNEELIRAGLARAELGFHGSESMKTRFRRAEREAKAAGRGSGRQP
jgi:micrococcal nuclease